MRMNGWNLVVVKLEPTTRFGNSFPSLPTQELYEKEGRVAEKECVLCLFPYRGRLDLWLGTQKALATSNSFSFTLRHPVNGIW